jgi:glycosyltransferase involved in cell wall biosynthesis
MNRGPIRLGVVCDYLEERWASMDLVAEMVLDYLARRPPGEVLAESIRPAWRGRFTRLPIAGRSGLARNADRVINRFHEYPKHIRESVKPGRFDLFHLVDHSYAQLVPELPAGRTVVTCHDLNAFRCVLEPAAEPRPRWFRALARRTLDGLRGAAAVACNSEATRADILRHGLLPPEALRVVHIAVHPACSPEPDPDADARARDILGPVDPDAPEILHVGTSIPRKRIDVLLNVFARIKDAFPAARLVKVGGRFAPEHQRLAEALGVAGSVAFAPYIEPAHHAVIASMYRRAALVLLPSDHEGFGIPAAEAMACGAPMIASDLPVLREVGGDALLYQPTGDVDAWSEAAVGFLRLGRDDSARHAMRAEGLARASRFAWPAHVDALMEMYRDVLDGRPVAR